jgi:hypothetical protein
MFPSERVLPSPTTTIGWPILDGSRSFRTPPTELAAWNPSAHAIQTAARRAGAEAACGRGQRQVERLTSSTPAHCAPHARPHRDHQRHDTSQPPRHSANSLRACLGRLVHFAVGHRAPRGRSLAVGLYRHIIRLSVTVSELGWTRRRHL